MDHNDLPRRRAVATALALSVMLAGPLARAQEEPAVRLPGLGADLTQTSVSGISSGGFMAAQLATAYSASVVGVGVIAAGPYFCAGTYPSQSFLQNATAACMSPAIAAVGPQPQTSLKNAETFAAQGRIDPVANLARQRVYVFSGQADRTVKTMVSATVPQYYALAGAAPAQILYRHNVDAGHSIIVNNSAAVVCKQTAPPYINYCGFNQAAELLAHIYAGNSQPPVTTPGGQFIRFDQHEFIVGQRSSMDVTAYAYVPADCTGGGCKVHVALHGCEQGARVIGDQFYRGTGYNEYADSNRLIVLYPQAWPSNGIPVNPKGCWDFFGYSDANVRAPAFYAREAPQMSAIMAMVRRLGEAPAAP